MYYYNNEMPPQQGWICPKCGRVNAPWMPTCGCVSSQTKATIDTTPIYKRAEQTEPSRCKDCKWHKPIGKGGICSQSVFCKYEPKQTEPQTDCSWQKGE